jgi:hypothetical protein
MADETSNIILEHLRHIRGKVDNTDRNLEVLTLRVGAMERILAGNYQVEVVQNVELDRLKSRVDRIERRLELSDG